MFPLYDKSDFRCFPGSGSFSVNGKRYEYATTSMLCAVGVGSQSITFGKGTPTHHFLNGVHFVNPNSHPKLNIFKMNMNEDKQIYFVHNDVIILPVVLQMEQLILDTIENNTECAALIMEFIHPQQYKTANELFKLSPSPSKKRRIA